MKKINSFCGLVRVLSILFVPVCFFIDFFSPSPGGWSDSLARAILGADFLLLLGQPSSAKPAMPFSFALAIFVSGSFASFSGIAGLQLYLSVGWTSLFVIIRYIKKFSDLKPLFKNDAPLQNLQEYSFLAHFSFLCAMTLLMEAGVVPVSLVLSAAAFVILFEASRSSHIPALGRDREKSVRDIIKGNLRSSPYVEMDLDSRMNALYARAVEYMEKKQPFLDEDFSLAAMSTALFTNKSYLSRVINYYSGRNFKQFVNFYRIRYAVDLISQDPRLSVLELATMSGFHSVVTFNVAFRLNMNDTPGAYCRNVMA